MDFDTKILLFKKKALWKQIEGYKKLLSQRELEFNQCQQKKEEAERAAKAINLALSKISISLPQLGSIETEFTHESFDSIKDFIIKVINEKELSQNFISIINILSQKFAAHDGKIVIQASEPSSEIQKELQISELESKLIASLEKSDLLENRLFSLEKKISVLQLTQNNIQTPESPSKRPRVIQDDDPKALTSEYRTDQEMHCKISILNTELEELKKISSARATELESFFIENKKLKEELEYKRDQMRKIPQELLKDGATFHQLNDDIKRYKNDINNAISTIKSLEREIEDSNYRHNKIISSLERDLKDKYTRIEDFVKTTDSEIARLRKDRDSMRQMYEETNALLSSCQKQLICYQKNLNCSESAINQLTGTVQKLKAHLSLIPALSCDSTELSKAIENLRTDEQLYLDELENLGKSFEQIQIENSNLIKKIADKDEQLTKLLGDKLKAEFSLSQIQKEAESSLIRAQKIEEISNQRVSEAEAREDSLRRQTSSIDKSISDQIVLLNGYKSRLNEAAADNSLLRSKIEKYVTEVSELKSQIPASSAKDQLLFEKRRLGEELSVANKKIEIYSASGIGISKDLEDELSNYKKLMKCNSCHIRDKNAVILKCMHCFCKTCLDVRLETRQRKCPNCGDAFGANDVKQIFL